MRAILYHPLTNGRSVKEIVRLPMALRISDAHKVGMPAEWRPGEDVIVPPSRLCGAAKGRVEKATPDMNVSDWFVVTKPCPQRELGMREHVREAAKTDGRGVWSVPAVYATAMAAGRVGESDDGGVGAPLSFLPCAGTSR